MEANRKLGEPPSRRPYQPSHPPYGTCLIPPPNFLLDKTDTLGYNEVYGSRLGSRPAGAGPIREGHAEQDEQKERI
jgi:hypothetical protein